MRLRLALLAALIAAPAHAQGNVPDYVDDRSTPAALVQSHYNAINRGEYLRAWSYFGANAYARDDDADAQADYEAMKTLYEEPAFFEVLTGTVTEEGAAGSTYSYVPVALKVRDGKARPISSPAATRSGWPSRPIRTHSPTIRCIS